MEDAVEAETNNDEEFRSEEEDTATRVSTAAGPSTITIAIARLRAGT